MTVPHPIRIAVVAAAIVIASACNSSGPAAGSPDADTTDTRHEDIRPTDDATDTRPDDVDPPTPVERLELPLVPVERTGLPFQSPLTIDDSGAVPVLRASLAATVAVGERYPSSITIVLSQSAFTLCGVLEGRFAIETVALLPTSEGVGLERASDDEIRVLAGVVGRGAATVSGTFTASADNGCVAVPVGEAIDFELDLVIDAREVDRVEVDAPFPCTGDEVVVAVGARPALRLALYDVDGRAVYPLNARPGREADVVIEADAPFVPPPDGGTLADLVMPSRASTVSLTPAPGTRTEVRVVEAGAVTGAEVEFVVAGYAAGSTSLESGAHYDQFGARKANRIVPTVAALAVGDAVLCGAPAFDWFALTSATPGVCEVRPIAPDSLDTLDTLVIPDNHVDLSAYLHADGRCALTLRADGFAGGGGFEAVLDATFADVELLSDVP